MLFQAFWGLGCIHANSPRYGTNLGLSHTGHHIPHIKSSFELFCALVCDLALLAQNLNFCYLQYGFRGISACI